MKALFLFLTLLTTGMSQAQYPWPPEGNEGSDYFLNQRDKQDGLHYRTYGDGSIYYAGEFAQGKPKPNTTLFYYTDKGLLMSTHTFGSKSSEVSAKNFHPNDELQSEGRYVDQKKEGEWKFYDLVGNLLRIERYSNNLLQGDVEVYYASGKLYHKETYVDSILQGEFVDFFEDGKIKTKGSYLNGDYDGDILYNFDTGKKLLEAHYENGKKEGKWLEYNRNGTIRMSFIYEDNVQIKKGAINGEFIEYYANGIPMSVYNYKNGKLHGIFEEWYDKGEFVKIPMESGSPGSPLEYKQKLEGAQIQREGEYQEGELYGDIVYYSEIGNLIKTETYENGQLVDTVGH